MGLGSSILVESEIEVTGFSEGRKTREHREKALGRGENQQQTQPLYGTGPVENLGHIVGWRVLSSLHHSCYTFNANSRGPIQTKLIS